jgi:hypothetical protein
LLENLSGGAETGTFSRRRCGSVLDSVEKAKVCLEISVIPPFGKTGFGRSVWDKQSLFLDKCCESGCRRCDSPADSFDDD